MASVIRFDNGATYERYMGLWSQLAGAQFLDWIGVQPGLDWLDVGCGNGAFTELVAHRCTPLSMTGIDPAEGQLRFARTRPALQSARLELADAMALPYSAASFDVAVMPLVIFFVPEPAQGVGEMVRVVRPGGLVTAYAWDVAGGGFPYDLLNTELRSMGVDVPLPPQVDASGLAMMHELWRAGGLLDVAGRTITVHRTYVDFEDYWTTIHGGPNVGAKLAALSAGQRRELEQRLRARLPADAQGRITCSARANAIKGRVPGGS